MSDKKLQELQRIHDSASTDIEIGAALLRVKLRVGELGRWQVELGAYCGEESAAKALGWSAPLNVETWLAPKFPDWLKGLERFGKMATVRAAIAAARCALPVWEKRAGFVFGRDEATFLRWGYRLDRIIAPRRAIAAAEAWVECPDEAHRRAACVDGWSRLPGWCRIARLLAGPSHIGKTQVELFGLGKVLVGIVCQSDKLVPEPQLRIAIQDALISWALSDL